MKVSNVLNAQAGQALRLLIGLTKELGMDDEIGRIDLGKDEV